MAKTQQQRARSNESINGSRKTRARTGSQRHSSQVRWAAPLAIAAAILVGLIAWWVMSSFAGNDSADSASNVQPIATLDSADFHSLLVDPQDPEHVLFGSHAGIQESRDSGFTWEDGELRNADAMQLAASPKAPETLYATGHDVFQVSQDSGQTWQPVMHDLPGTDIHGFAQDPDTPQRLYALVMGAGILTSGDGGTTWKPLPTQLSGGGMHIALASSAGSLYAATDTGLMVSRDNGQSWQTLPSQPSGGIISLAAPVSDPQTLYAGTPSGLAKSTNGGESWTNLGPEGVPVLAIAVTPSDSDRVFLLSDEGAVYRSVDGGATWR